MATYLARGHDVLDDLCWRHYGRQAGAAKAALDANPGLADQGPIYPAGVSIVLPDLPVATVASSRRLWD
jgi:phage tail protein X